MIYEIDSFTIFFCFPVAIGFAESPWDTTDVDPNHDWTITFNQKVDQATVNEKTIYVLDKNQEIVKDNVLKVIGEGNKVVVEAPTSGYSFGDTYTLVVTTNVLSEKKQPLKEIINMTFTIVEGESNPLKDNIKKALLERQTSYSFNYVGDINNISEKIEEIIYEVLSENEYLNYDFRGYSASLEAIGNKVTIHLNANYFQTKEQVEYVDQRIQEILDEIIDPTMNNHEKVKAVHDYVVLNVEYDTSYNQIVNAPYFALTEGKTLCNGYAMLVYLMLEELDIPVRLISGEADGIGHAWNLVQLDGKWYHLDATWDDPVPDKKGRVLYNYYLLTDDDMRKDHYWENGGLNGREMPYPRANTNYLNELMERGEMELIESLGLHYLTPDWTITEEDFIQFVNDKFSNEEEIFTFRYVTNNEDVFEELRQLTREAAYGTKARGWSWELADYPRTEELDYLITMKVTY